MYRRGKNSFIYTMGREDKTLKRLNRKKNRYKSSLFRVVIVIITITLMGGGLYFLHYSKTSKGKIGKEIDSYKNVPVYYNGLNYTKTYGESHSEDGYYYGYKWQCVEYIKRFYKEAKNHEMPDVYGNAKDFFDNSVPQGELNKSRDLIQYRNEGNVKPEPDDLIVFSGNIFGHVAIVTEVTEDYVEVIQQNVYSKTREKYDLTEKDGKYIVGKYKKIVGWLRKKQ